jgi:hypothetical protein
MEAGTTARALQRFPSGRKVWFYDTDVEVSDLLLHQLDLLFTRVAEHSLSGPYHKRILEYARGS